MLFLFFLFKQKTAYEMRISDWSSDVCSSDLQAEAGNVSILRTGDPATDAWIEPFLDELCLFPAGAHDDQVDAAADAFNELALGSQIGRASCRERVCQYV